MKHDNHEEHYDIRYISDLLLCKKEIISVYLIVNRLVTHDIYIVYVKHIYIYIKEFFIFNFHLD
jgi:hypothetical protein